MGYMTINSISRINKYGTVFFIQSPSSRYGPHFRPIHGRYRPTRGGRWQVRKAWDPYLRRWCWRAWTSGRASYYNMNFDTQADAFQWASLVARFHMINDWEYFRDLNAARMALKAHRQALTKYYSRW